MRIQQLTKGDRVRLVSFGETAPAYRQRLLSLGLTCGCELQVIRQAPLGCPLQVEVRGTSISLRKEEAQHLILELI